MGQVQSTDYQDGRHVTSFHIKALGIKFTKKSKKHKHQPPPIDDDQLENLKVKSKKRSLLSYLGKHLKLTKKKNVVKSSSRQLINKPGYRAEPTDVIEYKDYQPKSSIDDSVTDELNNRRNSKLSNQQKTSQQNAQLHRLNSGPQPVPPKQTEPKSDLTSELDNELTDIPLNSETNSLTHQTDAVGQEDAAYPNNRQLNLNNLNNLNNNLNNLSNANQPNLRPADDQPDAGLANRNRLSSTFSTYDLKAQLNSSTNLPNNRDQQTKLSSMLNWRSYKDHRAPLGPLEDNVKGEEATENPSKPPNGLPNSQPKLLRPINNVTINNNSLNGNLNSVAPKNGTGYQNKHLLTEANNAISAISTMRNGIILTSGHPKVVDFNAIAKNNGQQPVGQSATFTEPTVPANALPQAAPKASQSSSQTKTIIQVGKNRVFASMALVDSSHSVDGWNLSR